MRASASRARTPLALGLALTIACGAAQAVLYKWVDDKGHTHYGETPPPGRPAEEVAPAGSPQPAPKTLEEQEREFQKRRLERLERERAAPPAAPAPAVSGPPKPSLVTSQYLTTTRTSINYEVRGGILSGTIRLTVKAKRENPGEVWLLAAYEIPPTGTRDTGLVDNPDPYLQDVTVDGLVRLAPNDEVTLTSPLAEHFRCRIYYATVQVYADSSGREVIAEHRQAIESRLNGMRIRTEAELRDALRSTSRCAP